jgi:hypothetical protein
MSINLFSIYFADRPSKNHRYLIKYLVVLKTSSRALPTAEEPSSLLVLLLNDLVVLLALLEIQTYDTARKTNIWCS